MSPVRSRGGSSVLRRKGQHAASQFRNGPLVKLTIGFRPDGKSEGGVDSCLHDGAAPTLARFAGLNLGSGKLGGTVCRPSARRSLRLSRSAKLGSERSGLLQLCEFRLGLFQDGNVGFFPKTTLQSLTASILEGEPRLTPSGGAVYRASSRRATSRRRRVDWKRSW